MPVVETHLFDVVKEIGPMLQEAGKEGERERRLPKRAIDQLAEAPDDSPEDLRARLLDRKRHVEEVAQ